MEPRVLVNRGRYDASRRAVSSNLKGYRFQNFIFHYSIFTYQEHVTKPESKDLQIQRNEKIIKCANQKVQLFTTQERQQSKHQDLPTSLCHSACNQWPRDEKASRTLRLSSSSSPRPLATLADTLDPGCICEVDTLLGTISPPSASTNSKILLANN